MRDVCGAMRGAGGAGGAPVSSGLVRRLGLRVCLVYRSCCLLPAALVLVPSERAVMLYRTSNTTTVNKK